MDRAFQAEQVILAYQSGHSISEIACQRALTRQFVQTTIKQFNETGKIKEPVLIYRKREERKPQERGIPRSFRFYLACRQFNRETGQRVFDRSTRWQVQHTEPKEFERLWKAGRRN